MVSVYCILNLFSLLIFANFAFCDDSKHENVESLQARMDRCVSLLLSHFPTKFLSIFSYVCNSLVLAGVSEFSTHSFGIGNSSVSTEMTDKMLPDEDHLIAEHCLKCTRSKYYQRNTKYCEMCSEADVDMVKEFPGLCKSCVKKKFRENNSFCQECPPFVIETTFDKVKGGEKFKKKHKKPLKKQTTARTTTTIRPVFSTTTTPIELGPFGKILRDLIHANTFIDK